MGFAILIYIVIIQRVLELLIARRNEKWLLKNGAVEYGQRQYLFIVALHALFIASLIAEYIIRQKTGLNVIFLSLYIVLVALKIWTISSLGKYWNTKIFRIPGMAPVNKGPYKFLKHPNYIIVIGEIAVIPLIFNLYFTAVVFSILNAIVLNIRIKDEDRVWKAE
jgi:methyltransferase